MKTQGIIMGVGAPNDSSKHGKTFCAIVLTSDLGFIRIYPIRADLRFPVWGMVSLDIEKGSDPRAESYKVNGFEIGAAITESSIKREILDRAVLKSGMNDPMAYQNENRRSIFLVKSNWSKMEASLSQKEPAFTSADEEFGWIVTQGKHWLKPYIKWTSDQGKTHTSHLGGREIYEGLRNNPQNPWQLMNNIQIMNPDYEHWLLMGNQKDRMNVWLCVHLHRLKKSISGSTPLFSHPVIGNDSAWPYNKQADSNVEIADGHPMLFTMKDMISTNSLGSIKKAM
jgi:hypothetical protein